MNNINVRPSFLLVLGLAAGLYFVISPASAVTLEDVVTPTTSYIVTSDDDGQRVTLLPSGPDRDVDVTAEAVCSADEVYRVSTWTPSGTFVHTNCK